MAWIKVTRFGHNPTEYLINTDKLVTIGRPSGANYTNLWETGNEDEEPRHVKETPDELLALIRLAELDNRGVETFTYAHPSEV